jgi:uncharacterized protein (TIGR02266 family)
MTSRSRGKMRKPALSEERRRYPRIEARIKVSFSTVEELIQEYTRNISTGGIFLKTDRLLDPNAVINLTIEFPEGLGVFTVHGRVVRLMVLSHPTEPGKQLFGAGIRFVDAPPGMIEVIGRLVAQADPRKAGNR